MKWEEERGKGALGIKSVFGTQSNGAFFFAKMVGFYFLTIFTKKLHRRCSKRF